MIEPIGIAPHETAVTVALLSPAGLLRTRWLYCQSSRLKDADFVQWVLSDSIASSGVGLLPGIYAAMLEGLLSDDEVAQQVKGAQRQ